ncbi:MAG: 3-phosphoshikimate 1-carboxyvinyltransferase [Elusimicrobia bacterium]|nr:3-phosphoshikimate 1-carboxyvinyltransferase [Elusimicrobiota bacterium]
MKSLKIKKAKAVSGRIEVPSDKSISHRAAILASIARGKTKIYDFLRSDDTNSTLRAVSLLGAKVRKSTNLVTVEGCEYKTPSKEIYCGNSGTTMRLLSGMISGFPVEAKLTGDESLSKRPMSRIAVPLEKMGARVKSRNGYPPLTIRGGRLKAIRYILPVASAQVKTAILLAGLNAVGLTYVKEKIPSRDHTERMLPLFGVKISKKNGWISLRGCQRLKAAKISVPGDISAAAFFITAAALLPGGIEIKNVGVNPTRTGFLSALRKMGLTAVLKNKKFYGKEPAADILVKKSFFKSSRFGKKDIPAMIDEIPLLALCATQAKGVTVITGSEELKYKESDRLEATYSQLKKMGAKIKLLPDGFEIHGPSKLKGARVKGFNDHRIIMMLALAALIADGETIIDETTGVSISFPDFFRHLEKVTVR